MDREGGTVNTVNPLIIISESDLRSLVHHITMQASQLMLLLLLLLHTITAQISINFSLDNLAAVAGGLGEAS